MYADREPRVSRHVQIEYKTNAAEFGMGKQRHRSRSPFRRAVTRSDATGDIEVARRVYVGNLAYCVAWQDLKDHFKPIGQVIHADVATEGGQGSRSKGWGIVEFEKPEEAAAAIQQLDRSELNGREIFLREDRQDFELTGSSRRESGSSRQPERGSASTRGPPSRGGRPNVAVVGRRLFVNNLSLETTWQSLKDYFKTCGHVVHADVFTDEEGQSKGAGVVEFQHCDEALQAISRLTNTTLDGSQIRVREDREDADLQRGRSGNEGRARSSRDSLTSGRGVKVIVQGLPFAYAWQDLKDLFKPIGGVLQADIVMGRDGRSKGWGTVNFETEADAERAIQRAKVLQLELPARRLEENM
ncbi:TPA: hypothetical protein ACH3X3_010679 [Trebouxia sp. C0006]